MDPLTVLLWLICAFIIVIFFSVVGLFVYMIKERKKAMKMSELINKSFDDARRVVVLNDPRMVQAAHKAFNKAITKGPSQGV